jgi:hypothetical protein
MARTNPPANHSIPIELGLADRFSIYVSDVRTFAGTPLFTHARTRLCVALVVEV